MTSRAALVLAYNEEENLPRVLTSLLAAKRAGVIQRILVVDDGSIDRTSQLAHEAGVEFVRVAQNKGKAFGFAAGAMYFSRDPPELIALFDADLEAFRPQVVEKLFEPLERNPRQKMSIASFHVGVMPVKPEYSGERAIRFSALTPLLKKNRKWLQFLGLKIDPDKGKRIVFGERVGYGLEDALAKLLIPRGKTSMDIQVDAAFHSLRTESKFGRSIMHAEINAPNSIARQRLELASHLRRWREMNYPRGAVRTELHEKASRIRFRKR